MKLSYRCPKCEKPRVGVFDQVIDGVKISISTYECGTTLTLNRVGSKWFSEGFKYKCAPGTVTTLGKSQRRGG